MSSLASAPVQSVTPEYTLFDANAVAAATFLGTPVAGASLMAINYSRLGQRMKALSTLLVGIVVSALVILLAWNLPRGVASIIAFGVLFGTRRTAEMLQGSAVSDQVQRGGRLGSRWAAFGLGAIFFAVIFGIAFAIDNTPKVVIGSHDEVFYSGSVTKAEALALGDALKQDGYFSDRGVTVIFTKEKNDKIVSFVVKEGAWNQPSLVSSFEEVGRHLAPAIGGFPVRIRLLNTSRAVEEESTVGKVDFAGGDTIYYLGSATESDAQSLGKALKSNGFFQSRGSDVFLAKHKDGVILSFIVRDGALDDSGLVGNFEKVARGTANAVGGLPLRLRLLSTSLEMKKEVWVR